MTYQFHRTPHQVRCTLLATCLASMPAAAQVVRGEIAVGAGVSTDQRGVKSNALTVAPGVLFAPDPHFSAAAGLTGTRFGAESRAVGGTLSLGVREPLGGGFALAASGTGALTRTSFNASYGVADLTPTLEGTLANVTVFAGGHLASGVTTTQEVTAPTNGVPGLPAYGARDVTVSHTSVGPVFGAMLNVPGSEPSQSSVLYYREEHARVAGAVAVDRVASGSFTTGALSLSVSGGLRDASDEKVNFGSIAAGYAISSSVVLQGSAGTYPSNRVLGTVGGSYASVGVLLHAARRLSEDAPAAIVVRGAPPIPAGATRLALRAPDAKRVEIAGDWNQWTTTPVTRATDGSWYTDVRLSPGEYRYAFKVDGQRWVVPEGATSVDDGFGGRSAIVTIR